MPPRSAGLLNGGCVGIADFALNVYLYLPGQRRVRRAPEIGLHDSPSFGSDGMRTIAGWYMGYFGGHDSHHDRKLVGLREAFIPYNNFKLASDEATPDKLFLAKHINQDLVRYELHRVWEVDAVRKPGIRDLYKRHVSYYDEDTWQGVAMEVYDSSDRLWRVGEQYLLYYYGINAVIPYGDVAVDLINGRYTTFPFWYRQAEKMVGRPGFTISSDSTKPLFVLEDYYTPQGLRKSGMR